MTDDVDQPSAEMAATSAPTPPVQLARPAASVQRPAQRSGPRPASKLEITGWAITALGVLVLVYFALTRSFG